MAENTGAAMPVLGKKKELAVPSKRTMNFVHHQSSVSLKRLLPVIAVVVVAAALLAKFGLYDQIQKKTAAYAELSERQTQLSLLNAGLVNYADVEAEYTRFSSSYQTEKEKAIVDRMQALELIETVIMPKAVVENIAINDNVISLSIHGLTLNQASEMVKELEASEIVGSATIYNATADNGKEAVISMTIQLERKAAEEE